MTQFTSRMHLVRLADVRAEPVRWLWPGYLPLGKLVVVDGNPGQGKSTLLMDIAARLSRGGDMPDGSRSGLEQPAESVFLTYEDDASDTLKPRLRAAGGDDTKVHHVRGVSRADDPDTLLPPQLPEDLAALEESIAAHPGVRLIVIDPLSAALGSPTDTTTEIGVRRVLARLVHLARDSGACVVVLRHLRKDAKHETVTAGMGSIGIIAQARVGLMVTHHPQEPNASVLFVTKNNLAAHAAPLAFAKSAAEVPSDGGAPITTVKLDWLGPVELTPHDFAPDSATVTSSAAPSAERWLAETLSNGKELLRQDVLDAGVHAGFSERALDRAANAIGVVKRPTGFGAEKTSYWSLPAPASNPANPASEKGAPDLAGLAELKPTSAAIPRSEAA